jgi:hypothetical protein
MMGMGMMKRKGRQRFQMRIWRGHLLSTCKKLRLPPKIRSYRLLLPFSVRKVAEFTRVDPPSRPGFAGPTPRWVFT